MDYLKELSRSIREHGTRQTLANGLHHVRRRILTYADLGFDLKHGVDTCALKSIHALDIDEDLKPWMVGYEPTPVRVVRGILQSLAIDHSEFTFIDYGSGKGRVLLLASEYPYKQILGIELSSSLHNTSVANIAAWNSPAHGCDEITALNINATEFELPKVPLVVFFFTPFFEPVLAGVVDRIQSYLKGTDNPMYIIYYGARSELVAQFRRLNLDHKEIHAKWTLSAIGQRTGHLFYRGH